jgi:hypothetical protein
MKRASSRQEFMDGKRATQDLKASIVDLRIIFGRDQ